MSPTEPSTPPANVAFCIAFGQGEHPDHLIAVQGDACIGFIGAMPLTALRNPNPPDFTDTDFWNVVYPNDAPFEVRWWWVTREVADRVLLAVQAQSDPYEAACVALGCARMELGETYTVVASRGSIAADSGWAKGAGSSGGVQESFQSSRRVRSRGTSLPGCPPIDVEVDIGSGDGAGMHHALYGAPISVRRVGAPLGDGMSIFVEVEGGGLRPAEESEGLTELLNVWPIQMASTPMQAITPDTVPPERLAIYLSRDAFGHTQRNPHGMNMRDTVLGVRPRDRFHVAGGVELFRLTQSGFALPTECGVWIFEEGNWRRPTTDELTAVSVGRDPLGEEEFSPDQREAVNAFRSAQSVAARVEALKARFAPSDLSSAIGMEALGRGPSGREASGAPSVLALDGAFLDVATFMRAAGQDIASRPRVPALRHSEPISLQLLVRGLATHLGVTAGILGNMASFDNLSVSDRLVALRVRLILSETGEFLDAVGAGDAKETADALADMIYVILGTALAFGIDLPRVWAEVQRTNMAKFSPCGACGGNGTIEGESAFDGRKLTSDIKVCDTCGGTCLVAELDAGGKVVKPAGWAPPDVEQILAAQPELTLTALRTRARS